MRILYLSTWFPFPPDNGSRLRAYYHIKALSDTHNVSLVAFQPDKSTQTNRQGMANPNIAYVYEVPADPFRYVNLPKAARYLSPIPFYAWPSTQMRQIVRALSEEKWDAVIAFQMPAARYACIPSTKVRFLDIDSSLSFILSRKAGVKSSFYSRLTARLRLYKSVKYEARVFKRFHTCTVVSPLEVNFLRNMVKETSCRVELIGNGVDCEHNRPNLAVPRTGSLVYNGSLTYSANLDAMQWFLAEIYPMIRQKSADVSLAITGSTRDVDKTSLALDDTVTLTGYVEDVRIPIAESEICVVPIRKGHGTRIKVLEAMALGTPVVSTSKGVEGLDVADGEHLLIADDPCGFSDCVATLLNDAALRKRLSENARSLVLSRYDWQQIGNNFVELVEDTVSNTQ